MNEIPVEEVMYPDKRTTLGITFAVLGLMTLMKFIPLVGLLLRYPDRSVEVLNVYLPRLLGGLIWTAVLAVVAVGANLWVLRRGHRVIADSEGVRVLALGLGFWKRGFDWNRVRAGSVKRHWGFQSLILQLDRGRFILPLYYCPNILAFLDRVTPPEHPLRAPGGVLAQAGGTAH